MGISKIPPGGLGKGEKREAGGGGMTGGVVKPAGRFVLRKICGAKIRPSIDKCLVIHGA